MSLMLPPPFRGKHWFAVRRIGDMFYDLDSKHSKPLAIGNANSELLEFLATKLNGDGSKTELLLVVTADVFQAGSWKCDSDTGSTEPSDNVS